MEPRTIQPQRTTVHHQRWDRRQILMRAGVLGVTASGLPALLTACGGSDETDADGADETEGTANADAAATSDTVSNAPEASPATSSPDTASAATTTNAQASNGTLRIVAGFLPATLNPVQDGYTLVQYGMAETLTRVTPDAQIEPWLAEGVEATDESGSAWRITLRANTTFWDGAPVDAEAVRAVWVNTWETNPAAADYLDPATTLTVVDALTLDILLPTPQPTLANQLATFHLAIARLDDGAAALIGTGPYQVASFAPDDTLQLQAYAAHWSGTPPIATIDLRLVRDANARVLALQSGEADLATEVPAQLAQGLGGEIEVISGPSQRLHFMLLNHRRLPLSDPAARRAMSLGLDRDVLNQISLAGLGTVSTSLIPPGVGIDTPDELVADPEQAANILDEAGWLPGDGGVREKDGTRLAFTLYTYARRPELVPMAISTQDQLKALGFDIAVQQVEDIVALLENEEVDASMFSVNVLPTGDAYYALDRIAVPDADYNYLGYANAEVQSLVDALRTTGDPAERSDLALQAMELMRADTSHLFLLAAPRITALREGVVSGYQHHPNDLYLIDTQLRVQV